MRRALGVAAVWLALVAPVAADGDAADWTVSHRVTLPASGAPVDLAPYVGAGEGPARFAIRGSYSFLHDGSEIDATSRTVGGRRDVAAGPFVLLPPGAEIVERAQIGEQPAIALDLGVTEFAKHLQSVSEWREIARTVELIGKLGHWNTLESGSVEPIVIVGNKQMKRRRILLDGRKPADGFAEDIVRQVVIDV